ncbi:MAG TPA: phage portal protein [Firmicutes bacterium]|nr:phage portal protein [Bacillota bacterium]
MDPLTQSILETTESDIERLARYQRAWAYYKARAFFSTDDAEAKAIEEYLKARKLFKEMRDIFGCVARVVDTDARFTMKRKVAVEAEDRFATEIGAMWERSNFQAEKYKLVRFGANLGDAYLYLLPGPEGPVLYVGNTEDWTPIYETHDRTKLLAAKQSYTFIEGLKAHRWDRVFWPDRVETYIDEKLQDPPLSFAHPFGEVPVFHVRNIDIGERYGVSSWAVAQPKLDMLNEVASYMRQIIYRYADPKFVAKNVNPERDSDGRPKAMQSRVAPTGDNVLYLFGEGTDFGPIEFRGNVLPQVLEFMRDIYADIKDDLPELALSKLREAGDLSGYSVSLHLADATAKIDELRGSYGNAIEWANQVAVRATLRSKAPLEEFANRVVFEPILPEDRESKVRVWTMERGLGISSRRSILRADGLTDEEIETRLKEVDQDKEDDAYGLRLTAESGTVTDAGAGGGA